MRKGIILAALVLMFGITSISAQTSENSTQTPQSNDNPLLQMLARIPDTLPARGFLTYVDYPAVIAARPGAPTVNSWQAFNSYITAKGSDGALLMSALFAIQSGPDFFTHYLMQAGDMPNVVGFDIFDIHHAAEYGYPPASVTVLDGAFKSDGIVTAHQKRGYTESSSDGLTLLCPAKGCDAGMELDANNVNEANPFGGDLGRSQPVIVGDQFVASSPSIDGLTLAASTIAGTTTSLADEADHRAIAEAITTSGALLQTTFIHPANIGRGAIGLIDPTMPPSGWQSVLPSLRANFVPLPEYNLAAIADIATATEQQALVVVVYNDRADAEAAASMFPNRLSQFHFWETKQLFSTALAGSGVTSIEASVFPASTERYVMVLTFHAPLPSTVVNAGQPAQSPSIVYSLLVRAYTNFELSWLATQF